MFAQRQELFCWNGLSLDKHSSLELALSLLGNLQKLSKNHKCVEWDCIHSPTDGLNISFPGSEDIEMAVRCQNLWLIWTTLLVPKWNYLPNISGGIKP